MSWSIRCKKFLIASNGNKDVNIARHSYIHSPVLHCSIDISTNIAGFMWLLYLIIIKLGYTACIRKAVEMCFNMKLTLKSIEQVECIAVRKHNDVIKRKHIPRYWQFVRGINRSPVNSPHKGQWHGALVFSLICGLNKRLSIQSWGWYLRRHRSHYDVIIMLTCQLQRNWRVDDLQGSLEHCVFDGCKAIFVLHKVFRSQARQHGGCCWPVGYIAPGHYQQLWWRSFFGAYQDYSA